MPFDSKELYRAVHTVWLESHSRFQGKDLRLFLFCGYGKDPYFQLQAGYGDDNKVSGRDLNELLEELERRLGFAARQETLQLTDETEGEVVGE